MAHERRGTVHSSTRGAKMCATSKVRLQSPEGDINNRPPVQTPTLSFGAQSPPQPTAVSRPMQAAPIGSKICQISSVGYTVLSSHVACPTLSFTDGPIVRTVATARACSASCGRSRISTTCLLRQAARERLATTRHTPQPHSPHTRHSPHPRHSPHSPHYAAFTVAVHSCCCDRSRS